MFSLWNMARSKFRIPRHCLGRRIRSLRHRERRHILAWPLTGGRQKTKGPLQRSSVGNKCSLNVLHLTLAYVLCTIYTYPNSNSPGLHFAIGRFTMLERHKATVLTVRSSRAGIADHEAKLRRIRTYACTASVNRAFRASILQAL